MLARDGGGEVDLTRWLALQTWLRHGDHKVEIPYAMDLVELIPPQAVRLRRDVGATLSLIRAHAILHQASRERSKAGAIIATVQDFATVRDLILDVIAEGIGSSVSKAVRETVGAVKILIDDGAVEVMSRDLCSRLGLDKSPVSRRVRDALDRGFLNNKEERKGRPHRLVLGDPMPDDLEILPSVERLRSCAVSQGDTPPSPPGQQVDYDGDLEERSAIMEIDGETEAHVDQEDVITGAESRAPELRDVDGDFDKDMPKFLRRNG